MATAGRIVFEGKIAIDIILAEDGKYYVELNNHHGRRGRQCVDRRAIRDRGQGTRVPAFRH